MSEYLTDLDDFDEVTSDEESSGLEEEEEMELVKGLKGTYIGDVEYAGGTCYFYNKNNEKNLLGKGSYGEVFLGWMIKKEKTIQKVAIKVIHITGKKNKEEKWMEVEKQICFELTKVSHPNIMRIFDVVQSKSKKKLYIISEYYTGDLRGFLKSHKKGMREKYAFRTIKQIAQGLSCLKSRKIMHRDLKPENVFLVGKDPKKWTIKIGDFGQSKLGNSITQTLYCGTAAYVAPEIWSPMGVGGDDGDDSSGYDRRVDSWSLGVILYELVTGRLPFSIPRVVKHPFAVYKYTSDTTLIEYDKKKMSKCCIGLIKECLVYEKECDDGSNNSTPWQNRITVEQFLGHPVIRKIRM